MAFTLSDRTKQNTTTTGTSSYTLISPPPTGYQDFDVGIGNANTCYYCATAGNEWEIGLGTVSSGGSITLARTTIIQSTNSDAAVVWGSGTKEVFVVSPADVLKMLRITGTAQSIVITGGGNTITLAPASGNTIQGGLTVTGATALPAGTTIGGLTPVFTTETLTAGAGLTGGGDLSANRTFDVGAGTGITVNANDVQLDVASTRNVDHSAVSVIAGAGLTGGGAISASVTVDVGAGSGITVNANDVQVDATVVRTSGGQTIAGLKEFSTRPQTGGVNHALITDITVTSAIYAGYIGSDGTTGNRLPAGWSASRSSTGAYDVTHNLALAGTTRLSIVATPLALASDAIRIESTTIGVNSFRIQVYTSSSGAAADSATFFIATAN
jgi:hypothetical protein